MKNLLTVLSLTLFFIFSNNSYASQYGKEGKEIHEKTKNSELNDKQFMHKAEYDKHFLWEEMTKGNTETVERFLRLGGKVDSYSNDDPLILIVAKCCENFQLTNPIAELLIDAGADLNVRSSSYNWTPLLYAASNDNFELIVKIIRKDPNTILYADEYDSTAVKLAEAVTKTSQKTINFLKAIESAVKEKKDITNIINQALAS